MNSEATGQTLRFPNPKVGLASDPANYWYRYYAGYSSDFVTYALENAAPKATSVLDPWNGTGTTSVLGANGGLKTFGYDINPAMVVVAKGRMLHSGVSASINALASDIVAHAQKVPLPSDPLRFWFSDTAAAHLRGLQLSVHRLLVATDESASTPASAVEGMSTLAAFFYTALFRTVRKLIEPAAGSNPTWWKARGADEKLRPAKPRVMAVFADMADQLRAGLHGKKHSDTVDITLGVASSRQLPLNDASIDVVVSSPPYCTRIDYAVSTRPELAILRYGPDEFARLRQEMVGTPTMNRDGTAEIELGVRGEVFLAAVGSHNSKASGGYYLKYYKQYYAAMSASLNEIRRVLRPGAPAVLVVQDTYYKQILNDTPAILLEMAQSRGFESGKRFDFAVPRTLAASNPKSRAYRVTSAATESVLVLH